MKKTSIVLTSVLLAAFLSAVAQAQDAAGPGQLSSQDMKFATGATQGGQMQVQLGQLASETSTNPMVRQFGEQMIKDHQRANDQLTHILNQKGVTIPMSEEMDTKVQEKLRNLKGEEFDQAYMKHMVKDHKTDVAAFKKEVADGDDPQLKDWAAQTLPVLQEHLKMAENTESSISR